MAYTTEDIKAAEKEKLVDPRSKNKKAPATPYKWWMAKNDKDLVSQLLSTTEYLKRTNQTRIRQASIFSRLFSGKPLYNFLGSNATLDSSNQLPIGRPTANVVYSCSDTLTSRITQDRPKPTFLTDGGNYKERKRAKEANQFIQGEFFRTKAYDLGALAFRDACVLGNGFLKTFKKDGKICTERTLETELLTDFNDAYYGNPRQLIQNKLVDRDVFSDEYPDAEDAIQSAVHGNVDSTPRSTDTISDQIIVAEAWHLPSSPKAEDGRHVIVCSEGVILDDEWEREGFPFVNFGYNPNMVGFFSQGLAEILMPTQMEIYRLLIIESQSIELMGIPRVLVEELSKIIETSFNNRIGTIIKYRNTPPTFVSPDAALGTRVFQWIQWLIQNAYQMSGISTMSAAGEKPKGLNSGEAIRSFDQIQEDRFAAIARRYQTIYTDLAYHYLYVGHEIAEEEGGYKTTYVGKNGTKEIDLKSLKGLIDNPIIQCYEESSLPKDPAGRQAKLSEMLAAGEITNQEFRRLSNFPDLEQEDRLASALEERILHALDEIVENGDKNYDEIAPDAFILDPTDMATQKATQYVNLYSTLKLEPEKMMVLHNWFVQVQALKNEANPAPPMAMPIPGGAAAGQSPMAVAPPQLEVSPTSGVAV